MSMQDDRDERARSVARAQSDHLDAELSFSTGDAEDDVLADEDATATGDGDRSHADRSRGDRSDVPSDAEPTKAADAD